MALSITQQPIYGTDIPMPAQSPIVYTVSESSTALLTNPSYQFVGELYYWTGSVLTRSGVPKFTITKYPNNSGVGIFDVSRIINSTLTDLAQINTSSYTAFSIEFYPQYLSGSQYVTGSHITSSITVAADGYNLFPSAINSDIASTSDYWPFLTAGPATQSVFTTNKGSISLYNVSASISNTYIDKIIYSGSNGQNVEIPVTTSTNTTTLSKLYPAYPAQSGFPLSGSFDWYTINGRLTGVYDTSKIKYEVVCNQKYPNVRIKWKNRYGQFDFFNFNMVSKQSFQTEKKTYQPQLGTWEGSTLSYNRADSSNLNYIVDSKQTLQVNTDWIPQSYNEVFKELMVSDEIYWIKREDIITPISQYSAVTPITIRTSDLRFKTSVVDKLIQYTFDFDLGQNYKLIL